ncbi:hypothetical protein FRC14_007619 [Serendipita sp. 396]|nr:hypothetical protein FRC14_007619 [Serendipita sp. 396]KAG8796895.1 hypothetical protein FRC16_009403 [Serendipita sp. 398]
MDHSSAHNQFQGAQDALTVAWKTRDISNIDIALEQWWHCLSTVSPSSKHYHSVLSSYALGLLLSWRARHKAQEIDAAINSLENALKYLDGHEDGKEEGVVFAAYENYVNLGAAYMDRWEVLEEDPMDLKRAAESWEQAHDIATKWKKEEESAKYILPNLGDAYCYGFGYKVCGNPGLLRAIECFKIALSSVNSDMQGLVQYKLGKAYSALYESRKLLDDLSCAIGHFQAFLIPPARQTVTLPPTEAEDAALELSWLYLQQYNEERCRSTIESAVYWARRAAFTRQAAGDSIILRRVAGLLTKIHRDFHDHHVLDDVIQCYEQAWSSMNASSQVDDLGEESRSTFCYNYGTALLRRVSLSPRSRMVNRQKDLEMAVRMLKTAIKIAEQTEEADLLAYRVQLKTATDWLRNEKKNEGNENLDTDESEDETSTPLRFRSGGDNTKVRSFTLPDNMRICSMSDSTTISQPLFGPRRQASLKSNFQRPQIVSTTPIQVWNARQEDPPVMSKSYPISVDLPNVQDTRVNQRRSSPEATSPSSSSSAPLDADLALSTSNSSRSSLSDDATERSAIGKGPPIPMPHQLEQPLSPHVSVKPTDLTGRIVKTSSFAVAEGGFSSIHIGRFGTTKVAIKVIRAIGGVQSGTLKKRLSREMDVWWKLEHPNIVPLLGYVDGFGPLHSPISPWYENGNASDYLKREGLGLEFRLQLLREVSSGLRYLHQQMPVIVHGDLKPGNVLIDNDGIARLCDFGLAHLVTSEGESMATGANVGTIRYSAPELRCPKDDDDKIMATTQTDIYSLACIAYEFFYLKSPYADIAAIQAIILAGYNHLPPARRSAETHPFHNSLIDHCWKLFEACWDENSDKRPDIGYFCEQIDLAFHAIEFSV